MQLASATASPFAGSPLDTPAGANARTPAGGASPSHSRSHSPSSSSSSSSASRSSGLPPLPSMHAYTGGTMGLGLGAGFKAIHASQISSSGSGGGGSSSTPSSRRGSLGPSSSLGSMSGFDGVGPLPPPFRRLPSQTSRTGNSENSSIASTSGIVFHLGGVPMGLGLDDGDATGGGATGGTEYSRSQTPPIPSSFPPSSTPSPPLSSPIAAANLSFEQLCQLCALLCAGIGSSFDTKRKDNAGKTYQNCFMGKEAINCLRQKMVRSSHGSAEQQAYCQAILQQALNEGFLAPAQSTDELDKIIAAKFAAVVAAGGNAAAVVSPPAAGSVTGSRSSPKLGPQPAPNSNPLALKINLSSIGAAAGPGTPGGATSPPLPLVFKKDNLYQLTPLWRTGTGLGLGNLALSSLAFGTGGSGPGSAAGSLSSSLRSSPAGAMFASSTASSTSASASASAASASAAGAMAGGGLASWYAGYSGFLGKKRENKGLGNSLALGLGVSAFQKRFFVVSMREGAVLYYKEDPNHHHHAHEGSHGDASSSPTKDTQSSSSQQPAPFPLGFIPFSEILLVDHVASTAAAAAVAEGGAGAAHSAGMGSQRKKHSLINTGSLSSALNPSSPPSAVALPAMDEKTGRLFDLVSSYRVYHLQADSTIEAMKWVAAIRESVREWMALRAGSGATGNTQLGSSAVAGLNSPQQQYATLRGTTSSALSPPAGTVGLRTPRTPEHLKRFWSNHCTPLLTGGGPSIAGAGSPSAAGPMPPPGAGPAFPGQFLAQVLLRDAPTTGANGLYGLRVQPQRLSDLRRHFFELNFSISALDQPSFFDALSADFGSDADIVRVAWNAVMRGTAQQEVEQWGPACFRPTAMASSSSAARGSMVAMTLPASALYGAGARDGLASFVNSSASGALLARFAAASEGRFGDGHDRDNDEDDDDDNDGDDGDDEEGSHLAASSSFSPALRTDSMTGGGLAFSAANSRRSSLVGAMNNMANSGLLRGGSNLPPPPRHRRAISGSSLPDSLGRSSEGRASSHRGGPQHHREESFNLQALQARRVINATRPFHRRFQSSLHPLPYAVDDAVLGKRRRRSSFSSAVMAAGANSTYGKAGSKFHDVHYMLLNRYALYHASATKPPSAGGDDAYERTTLNPSFLYRILNPYTRLESWLRSDTFLNLLLNDPALLNEVPLALPLVWAVLQWRNHDTDAGSQSEDGSSSNKAFVDDACLNKNWTDPSIDGEDDGFDGEGSAKDMAARERAAAYLSETEAQQVERAQAEKSKAGYRPVSRAHHRVNSFSTLVENPLLLSKLGSAAAGAGALSPSTAGSPLSPPSAPHSAMSAPPPMTPPHGHHHHHHAPVVYGDRGQAMDLSRRMGGAAGGTGSNRGSLVAPLQLTSLNVNCSVSSAGGGPQVSPSSVALSEYDNTGNPLGSPMSGLGSPLSPPASSPAAIGARSSPPPPPPPPLRSPVHIHLEHPARPSLIRTTSTPDRSSGHGLHVHTNSVQPPTRAAPQAPSARAASAALAAGSPAATDDLNEDDSPEGPLTPIPIRKATGIDDGVMTPGSAGPSGNNGGGVSFADVEVIMLPSATERGAGEATSECATPTTTDEDQVRPLLRASASMPTSRRNSLTGARTHVHQSSTSSNSSSGSGGLTSASGARLSRDSDSGHSVYTTPRALPRSVGAATAPSSGTATPVRGTMGLSAARASKSTPGTPTLQNMQQKRASIMSNTGTGSRAHVLGASYGTMRGSTSSAGGGSAVVPPIPLGLPHWKVRSLVGCRHCFQSSVEMMQVLSERYSVDGALLEAQRRRKAAVKAAAAAGVEGGKPKTRVAIETPESPPQQLTIALANSLFSLLLTPLWSLPYTVASGSANPLATDALNVLGKVIVQPHLWPAIIACLQSKAHATEAKRKHCGKRRGSVAGAEGTPAASHSHSSSSKHSIPAPAPYLVHHVLKDLNTLFIGSNVASNRRNCALLFKFFAQVARREAKRREQMLAQQAAEARLSDKDRERLERRRRKYGDERLQQRAAIGAWQEGLLELLRTHVPSSSGSSSSLRPHSGSSDAERLHSKIFQYALNLFGVLHFYKFQCITASAATGGGGKEGKDHHHAAAAGAQSASALEFERMLKESFWRAMHMDDQVLAARKEIAARKAAVAAAKAAGKPLPVLEEKNKHSSSSRRRSSLFSRASSDPSSPLVAHTVARALLTTMLQRLIFKVRSKTLALEGRYQAVAFVLALVKSFVFQMPLKHAIAGALLPTQVAAAATAASSSASSSMSLLGFELDFPSNHESLHRGAAGAGEGPSAASELHDDVELLEKALELLRALRLCPAESSAGGGSVLDLCESLPLAKQRELRQHVEQLAAANARQGTASLDKSGLSGGGGEVLVDALSKLRLSTAHDELLSLFAASPPSDQAALRFLQAHVSFFKDAQVFVALLGRRICAAEAQHAAATAAAAAAAATDGARRRAVVIPPSVDSKELQSLVARFVSMERREKVFCTK